MFKLGLEKARGTRDQIANICWIIEEAREFQEKKKNLPLFPDYAKAFNCVYHNKTVENSSRDGNTKTILTCLLRNLYAAQETTVRTLQHSWLVQDWEKSMIGCLLSPCLFHLYAEHIMRNARLDELQAGI